MITDKHRKQLEAARAKLSEHSLHKGENGTFDKKLWYENNRKWRCFEIWLPGSSLKAHGIKSKFPEVIEVIIGIDKRQAEVYALEEYGEEAWVDTDIDNPSEVCGWFKHTKLTRIGEACIPENHPMNLFLKANPERSLQCIPLPAYLS